MRRAYRLDPPAGDALLAGQCPGARAATARCRQRRLAAGGDGGVPARAVLDADPRPQRRLRHRRAAGRPRGPRPACAALSRSVHARGREGGLAGRGLLRPRPDGGEDRAPLRPSPCRGGRGCLRAGGARSRIPSRHAADLGADDAPRPPVPHRLRTSAAAPAARESRPAPPASAAAPGALTFAVRGSTGSQLRHPRRLRGRRLRAPLLLHRRPAPPPLPARRKPARRRDQRSPRRELPRSGEAARHRAGAGGRGQSSHSGVPVAVAVAA